MRVPFFSKHFPAKTNLFHKTKAASERLPTASAANRSLAGFGLADFGGAKHRLLCSGTVILI